MDAARSLPLTPASSRAFRRAGLTVAPPPPLPVDARAQRLAQARPMTGRRAFDAGVVTNLTADWTLSPLSADGEIRQAFRNLRARSREQERNESYAEAFLRLAEQNIIGDRGMTLQMKLRLAAAAGAPDGSPGELNVLVNRAVERAWRKQSRPQNYTVTRDMTRVDAGKLIVRTRLRDGDLLIRKVRGYANATRYAIQIIEGDFLDETYTDFRAVPCTCPQQFGLPRCQDGTHEVRMGVELQGDWKFPVAYWLLASHPGDYMVGTAVYSQKRVRVPVDEIIHPFTKKRPGQTRGIPAIACAMQRLHMLGGYEEAELVRARSNASRMGVIESEVPDEYFQEYFDPATGQCVLNQEPGQTEELPVGKKFVPNTQQGADAGYVEFHKGQLRGVSAGFGVSYTSLASNLEDVNFSSIRAGLLEEREMWKGEQQSHIAYIERPIFEDWLETQILTNQLPGLLMSELEDYLDEEVVCFQPRTWAWVDPVAEVAANKDAVAARFKTISQVIAEQGGDLEATFAELQHEDQLAKKLDLPPLAPPAGQAAAPAAAPTGKPAPAGKPAPDDEPDDVPAQRDQPRDTIGRFGEGGDDGDAHPAVGQTGSWRDLGLPSAENMETAARPQRISPDAAMEKLSTPYAKQDPLGNTVGFGQRLRDHLADKVKAGDTQRPSFLPHMEAAVENPAEIWAANTDKGPQMRHVTMFEASDGSKGFAVVSHRLGETRSNIVTGTPERLSQVNKLRTGTLLYVRPAGK